jgi:hypothetical protein
MIHKLTFFSLALVFCVVTVVGCGDGNKLKTYVVKGKITLEGEPLEGAQVIFTPVQEGGEARSASGTTGADGTYTLQTQEGEPGAGTTPGEYKVTVKAYESVKTGRKVQGDEGYEMVDEVESVLKSPKRYSNAQTTDLTATVKAEKENMCDFDLKK